MNWDAVNLDSLYLVTTEFWQIFSLFRLKSHHRFIAIVTGLGRKSRSSAIAIYLGVSPSLEGSQQHKRNNKNNGDITPFFQCTRVKLQ